MSEPLLEVRDLVTAFDTDAGQLTAVDRVSFSVRKGQTLGIVGESGCGKSVTALSIMRLLPQPMGNILGGSVILNGKDILAASEEEMHQIRGGQIGMIFQEPMTALNPVHRIGRQLSEVFLLHEDISKKEAWKRSIEMLKKVGIPAPEIRATEYPHQLSGGMRQRVVIAMALACKPSVLIADEPTTALDVTIQAQILELMQSLQEEMGMAIILITHDLGVIAETCDEVVVMYAGRVAERGPINAVFHESAHLYTKGLINSIPRMNNVRKTRLLTIKGQVPSLKDLPVGARFAPRSPHPKVNAYLSSEAYQTERPELVEVTPGHWVEDHLVVRTNRDEKVSVPKEKVSVPKENIGTKDKDAGPLLEIRNLKKYFPVKSGVFLKTRAQLKAVDDVSLVIRPGETLGLVGESGCGKSTLGKCVARLHDVTEGAIHFDGQDISQLRGGRLKGIRKDIQMIFQDPAESLNSRHTVGSILEEPLLIHGMKKGLERRQKVAELLDTVGLPKDAAQRFPFEFSGGQRQRIGVARAIALNPRLVICDEPVSALDVSVQSQILNLMMDLQTQFQLSYLFIAHDLAVVRHISDRIAIMYLGKIVELAPADEIFNNPLHAYTKALISAIPDTDPGSQRKRIILKGDVPSPIDPPPGCAFARRSWIPCTEEEMALPGKFLEVRPGHWVEVHPATVER